MIAHAQRLGALLGALLLLPAAATLAAPRELQVATLQMTTSADVPEARAIVELNDALVREICVRIAARCTQHPLPFADILPGVESGRFQLGVANVLHTPERERRVLFSQALWRSSSRLVGTTASIGRFGGEVRLADLRDAAVAVVKGTQQHRAIQGIAQAQRLRIVETESTGEAMALLLRGQTDFALMPVRSAYFLLQSAQGRATFTGPALLDSGLGGSVHAILPKREAQLRQDVDAALDAMRGDGTFQRILRRYMPFLAD